MIAQRRRALSARSLLLLFAWLLPVTAAAENGASAEERFFIVKDYRYVPGPTPGDPETGHSLCGTRCNALSVDYLNYTMPGGWRVIQVASDQELPVPLNNPFMTGHCVCTADEYLVKVDELSRPK